MNYTIISYSIKYFKMQLNIKNLYLIMNVDLNHHYFYSIDS
jgi:hypothetical protein